MVATQDLGFCAKACRFDSDLWYLKNNNMKFLKTVKKIEHDYKNHRYTFQCLLFYFIPIKLVCDWNDNLPNKKNGDNGFMHKEYYFLNKLIFKIKCITITSIPNFVK